MCSPSPAAVVGGTNVKLGLKSLSPFQWMQMTDQASFNCTKSFQPCSLWDTYQWDQLDQLLHTPWVSLQVLFSLKASAHWTVRHNNVASFLILLNANFYKNESKYERILTGMPALPQCSWMVLENAAGCHVARIRKSFSWLNSWHKLISISKQPEIFSLPSHFMGSLTAPLGFI